MSVLLGFRVVISYLVVPENNDTLSSLSIWEEKHEYSRIQNYWVFILGHPKVVTEIQMFEHIYSLTNFLVKFNCEQNKNAHY